MTMAGPLTFWPGASLKSVFSHPSAQVLFGRQAQLALTAQSQHSEAAALESYGQVTARLLTELGIERSRRTGLAAVALRNAHHIGRIGSYGEQCAAAGLVSLHFVNVTGHKPYVAPHRGSDARLATNPVCIAFPAAEPGRPVILDMATSKVAVW